MDNCSEILDLEIFGQLLSMDDDEQHEFSSNLVDDYFQQAETTIKSLQKALSEKNLIELSKLGHFLKGSSASIGLKKVKDACENMQQYGKRLDKDSKEPVSEEKALQLCSTALEEIKTTFEEGSKFLKNVYDTHDFSFILEEEEDESDANSNSGSE